MSRIGLLLLGIAFALAPQARADDKALEITPVLGFRGGAELDAESVGEPDAEADASLTFGVVTDFLVRPDARVEFFLDRQELEFEGESTDFDVVVDYLQAGGVYEPHPEGTRGFVGVALGLSHVDGRGSTTVDDSLGISGSIGGGVKVPLGSRLALRLELRGYATFSDSAFQAVCGPGCTVSFSSGGWYQLAARAGLAIRIGP
jgi:hypothetical protein